MVQKSTSLKYEPAGVYELGRTQQDGSHSRYNMIVSIDAQIDHTNRWSTHAGVYELDPTP